MAKRNEHLDNHLSKTWDYLSGTTPDSLLHDIFHVLYYVFVYVGGAALSVFALWLVVMFFVCCVNWKEGKGWGP